MSRIIKLIADDNYISLRNYLKSNKISTSMVRRLKRTENGIMLNGNSVFTNTPVNKGDIIILKLEDKCIVHEVDCDLELNIIYEDDDYILVNKPSGIAVHPTSTIKNNTLKNAFDTYCKKNNLNLIFRPVYRLDKNTSGLLVFAKNQLAVSMYKDAVKKYIAFCHGKTKDEDTITSKIDLEENSFIKRKTDDLNGKNAITHYKNLFSNDKYSALELSLETGRTHQIRVHMSSIGHPLVGDDLYGGNRELMNRQALHCFYIKFKNQISGKIIECSCELPSDMNLFIEKYLSGFRSDNIVY